MPGVVTAHSLTWQTDVKVPFRCGPVSYQVDFGKRRIEYSASTASGIPSQYISAIAMPIDRLIKTDGTHHLGGDEVRTGNCSNISISWVKLDNDRSKEKAEEVA